MVLPGKIVAFAVLTIPNAILQILNDGLDIIKYVRIPSKYIPRNQSTRDHVLDLGKRLR